MDDSKRRNDQISHLLTTAHKRKENTNINRSNGDRTVRIGSLYNRFMYRFVPNDLSQSDLCVGNFKFI